MEVNPFIKMVSLKEVEDIVKKEVSARYIIPNDPLREKALNLLSYIFHCCESLVDDNCAKICRCPKCGMFPSIKYHKEHRFDTDSIEYRINIGCSDDCLFPKTTYKAIVDMHDMRTVVAEYEKKHILRDLEQNVIYHWNSRCLEENSKGESDNDS